VAGAPRRPRLLLLSLTVRATETMAKKSKDDIPNANSVANRDILQRLNFLYQASVYLNGLPSSPDGSNLPSAKAEGKRSRRNRTRCANAAELAQSYMKDMKVVGKKTIVRMCVVEVCISCDSAHRSFAGILLSSGQFARTVVHPLFLDYPLA
jgi:hypothetical protein